MLTEIPHGWTVDHVQSWKSMKQLTKILGSSKQVAGPAASHERYKLGPGSGRASLGELGRFTSGLPGLQLRSPRPSAGHWRRYLTGSPMAASNRSTSWAFVRAVSPRPPRVSLRAAGCQRAGQQGAGRRAAGSRVLGSRARLQPCAAGETAAPPSRSLGRGAVLSPVSWRPASAETRPSARGWAAGLRRHSSAGARQEARRSQDALPDSGGAEHNPAARSPESPSWLQTLMSRARRGAAPHLRRTRCSGEPALLRAVGQAGSWWSSFPLQK